MSDFLDSDMTDYQFTASLRPQYGVYFDGDSFWSTIDSQRFHHVDIMSFSTGVNPLRTPIDRLIIGHPGNRFKSKEVPKTLSGYKVYEDLHAKMILCWREAGSKPYCIYVGSLNLCDSHNGEIMLSVTSWQQEEVLLAYFEKLWQNPNAKLRKNNI